MVTVLSFHNVSFVRDERKILQNITWEVTDNQRWVILGPNGSGKTTLMRLAAAHQHPSSGKLNILDQRLGRVEVSELRQRVGFVSSAVARRIPSTETVLNLVLTAAYGVEGRWNERYEHIDVRQAQQVLGEWDLTAHAEQEFGRLSDGERKRALIARAVMTDPEMLLLDEPSTNLDLGARERLITMLSGFAQSPASPAMVMVTHHVEDIPPGFTHVLMLKDGQVTAAGPLAETLTATNLEHTFGLPFTLTQQHGRYAAHAHAPELS